MSLEKASLDVSVVIPVFNEEESLPGLFERLFPVMEGLGKSWEVVFVNDGSRDRSLALLLGEVDRHPGSVRVVDQRQLRPAHGHHGGFSVSRAGAVVTMDADLQNPRGDTQAPGEMDAGHDVVGTIRSTRKDPLQEVRLEGRQQGHQQDNGAELHDYGCMLRAYSRRVVDSSTAVPSRPPSSRPWPRSSPSTRRR